jgi:hypothetical protein
VSIGLKERRIVVPNGFITRLVQALVDHLDQYYGGVIDGVAAAAEETWDLVSKAVSLIFDEDARDQAMAEISEFLALVRGPAQQSASLVGPWH